MNTLVTSLLDGKRVVFVTGSGLSIASEIPPFRGKSNASWKHFVSEWATHRKFSSNPLEWWNAFWLKAYERVSYIYSIYSNPSI